MHSNAKNVKDYINELEDPTRKQVIKKLSEIIKKSAPNIEETMEYKMPCYKIKGESYIAVASQKQYVSLYVSYLDKTLVAHKDLAKDFASISTGKCCLRFKPAQLKTMPFELIEKLIKTTYQEHFT